MEQYTKGNWKVGKSALGDWYISTDETLIASQVRHFNAHLISASPDLYEACKEIYEDYGFAFLKDILAKAEGKS